MNTTKKEDKDTFEEGFSTGFVLGVITTFAFCGTMLFLTKVLSFLLNR
jgi:hypothetical protein